MQRKFVRFEFAYISRDATSTVREILLVLFLPRTLLFPMLTKIHLIQWSNILQSLSAPAMVCCQGIGTVWAGKANCFAALNNNWKVLVENAISMYCHALWIKRGALAYSKQMHPTLTVHWTQCLAMAQDIGRHWAQSTGWIGKHWSSYVSSIAALNNKVLVENCELTRVIRYGYKAAP